MLNITLVGTGILFNVLCIWSINLVAKDKITFNDYLKYCAGGLVAIVLSLLYEPFSIAMVIVFAVLGSALGELIWLFYFVVKKAYQKETQPLYYDDGTPAKFYITGDKHRNFEMVKSFCRDMNTRRKDVLIILGDAGFNYYDDERDDKLKKEISTLNITLFCLHGNKENRPQNVGTYGTRNFCNGKVYYEPRYPNILFAIDGELYNFEGKKYMVVGGAHSVDKMRCLDEGKPFWEDEMPDDQTKKKVEARLTEEGNSIYGMMTHTCPVNYLPTEMFISTKQNAEENRKQKKKRKNKKNKLTFKPDIDRSTETWLGELEKKIDFTIWFCGHYHIDKEIDKVNMLYHSIRPLHLNQHGDNNG